MHFTAWSKGLDVTAGGQGIVSHAGVVLLRALADRTGLTGGLSKALARRRFVPLHDRVRVLADLAGPPGCPGGRCAAAATVRMPQSDGAVVGEGVQVVPSQCRIRHSGRCVYHPAAQMSRPDLAALDSSLPPGLRGLGTIFQEVPSQC